MLHGASSHWPLMHTSKAFSGEVEQIHLRCDCHKRFKSGLIFFVLKLMSFYLICKEQEGYSSISSASSNCSHQTSDSHRFILSTRFEASACFSPRLFVLVRLTLRSIAVPCCFLLQALHFFSSPPFIPSYVLCLIHKYLE